MTLRLVAMAFLLAVTAFILRRFGWNGAPVFAVICTVVLLGEMADSLERIFGFVSFVGEQGSVGEPLRSALKVLGAGYLFGISADICRELGEGGIAKATETVGRVEIIAIVLPYFEKIIELGTELIG